MRKHAHGLSLVAVLWIAFVLACANSKPAPNTPNAIPPTQPAAAASPTEPPIAITSLALASAYDENEVAADDKFKGKTLLVSGVVESIDTVLGSTSVTLKGKSLSIVSVQCTFEDVSNSPEIRQLKRGGKATLQGVCDGKGLNVELLKCAIK